MTELVFVDTGAFFGLLVTEDKHHTRAHELFREAAAEQWRLVTSNATVYETYTLLVKRSRRGQADGVTFLDLLHEGTVHLERATIEDERDAENIVRQYTEGPRMAAVVIAHSQAAGRPMITMDAFIAATATVHQRCPSQYAPNGPR